jgi:ceramide glucosyltransferase
VNFLNATFAALAILSFVLLLWQFFAAQKFPLHKRTSGNGFAPAISILKPLKGCDATTAESLQSWLTQNYPGQTQMLFGVADANDPVCKIVEGLLKKNPHADAQLVLCLEPLGANAKVSKLARLEPHARHDLILICDADVRVPPDFLASFVAPLNAAQASRLSREHASASIENIPVRQPEVGLVNCFYRLAHPTTLAMKWEAVAINADFWSQVLQSRSLKPLDFALGAAILIRRDVLAELGGFKSLADCLADDYQLGNRIFKNGHRIALCPVVVECWDAPMGWRDVWKHQLRWARTIRVCQPLPYFFSILSNASLWPLLWFFISLPATKTFCEPLTAIAFLSVRICLAQNLQRRFTPERKLISPFWLVSVKDLLQAALWFCAFAGNTVEWRGRKMKLHPEGTLVVKN